MFWHLRQWWQPDIEWNSTRKTNFQFLDLLLQQFLHQAKQEIKLELYWNITIKLLCAPSVDTTSRTPLIKPIWFSAYKQCVMQHSGHVHLNVRYNSVPNLPECFSKPVLFVFLHIQPPVTGGSSKGAYMLGGWSFLLERFPIPRFWFWLKSYRLFCCLFGFHQTEISFVNRLIQGRHNVTRSRVEPETLRSWSRWKRRLKPLGHAADKEKGEKKEKTFRF